MPNARYHLSMRWQELFADLEAHAHGWQLAEREIEVADRTRGEVAQIRLVSRLRHRAGAPIRLHVMGAGRVAGRLTRVGPDWALLTTPDETVVATAAIAVVHDLPWESTPPESISPVSARTRLTSVLRAIARDRSTVVICLRDAVTLVGTPDRVGADWLDLAVHEAGQAPRRSTVLSRTTVPLAAIATLRRGRSGWD
jgi:hypothetical protein